MPCIAIPGPKLLPTAGELLGYTYSPLSVVDTANVTDCAPEINKKVSDIRQSHTQSRAELQTE